MRAIIIAAMLLSGCAARPERVVVQTVNVPVPVPCPAAADPPAKPDKPPLPADMEAALRTAVAHAARLTGWGDDLAGRLKACSAIGE
jgi:hypothetical protein